MTEAPGRAIPTPAAMAPRPRPAFDRDRWETAILSSGLDPYVRLVALVLARSGGPAGYLPADGPQRAARLRDRTGLSLKRACDAMRALEAAGFMTRPDRSTWQPQSMPRPITLTFPATDAPATRTEPAHPEAEG